MLESHSTNTTENTLSNFNGNHRALLLLIRAVRVLTGTALIIVCVPLSFVFPMFFDSPHTSPFLVFAVLFSFPLSFLLTTQLYKNSLVQGKMIKAFLYGTAPLLLIGSYAGIVFGLDWLTSSARHPASAIVATVGESKLFVKVPERCSPEIYILKYSMSGTWMFAQDKVDFICSQNFSENKDSFLISEGNFSISHGTL